MLRSYHASMRSPSTFSLSIAVRSASLSSSSMLSSRSRDSSCTDSLNSDHEMTLSWLVCQRPHGQAAHELT